MNQQSLPAEALPSANLSFYSPHGLRVEPTREDYQVGQVENAFDWTDIRQQIDTVAEAADIPLDSAVFVGAFRSIIKADADLAALEAADVEALAEAAESPALLCYAPGQQDAEGNCVTICIWKSLADAREITAKQRHSAAARLAKDAYAKFELEFYSLHPGGNLERIPRAVAHQNMGRVAAQATVAD
jgi:hypothetical protein